MIAGRPSFGDGVIEAFMSENRLSLAGHAALVTATGHGIGVAIGARLPGGHLGTAEEVPSVHPFQASDLVSFLNRAVVGVNLVRRWIEGASRSSGSS